MVFLWFSYGFPIATVNGNMYLQISAAVLIFHGCVTFSSARQMRVLVEASIPWRGSGISFVHHGISWNIIGNHWNNILWNIMGISIFWDLICSWDVHGISWDIHRIKLQKGRFAVAANTANFCPSLSDTTDHRFDCLTVLWRLLPVSSWQLILRWKSSINTTSPRKSPTKDSFFSHSG